MQGPVSAFKSTHENKYKSIAIPVICLSIILILSFSIAFYVNIEKTAVKFLDSASLETLKSVDMKLSDISNSAKTLSTQVYFDSLVSKLFSDNATIFDIQRGQAQLSIYRATQPHINSIYVYNSHKNTIYSAGSLSGTANIETFSDLSITDIIEEKYKTRDFSPTVRSIGTTDVIPQSFVYTYVFFDALGANSKNCVVINFSQDIIKSMTEPLCPDGEGELFFVNSDGFTMNTGKRYQCFTDLSSDTLISDIISGNEQNTFIKTQTDSETHYTSFSKSMFTDWYIIYTRPAHAIESSLSRMRVTSLIICLVMTVLAFFLTFLVLKRMYKPLNLIFSEVSTLKWHKHNYDEMLNRFAFKNFLTSSSLNHKEKIALNMLETEYLYGDTCILMVFNIDNYDSILDTVERISEIDSLKYGIFNIITELFQTFHPKTVDMHDTKTATLIAADNVENIIPIIEKIQQIIYKELSISLSVAVSEPISNQLNIPNAYSMLEDILKHKIFFESRAIITQKDFDNVSWKSVSYPSGIEARIKGELLKCNTDECERLYSEFLNIISPSKYVNFISANLRLLTAIYNINDSADISADYDLEKLSSIQTFNELKEFFASAFKNTCELITQKKSDKHSDIIDRVKQKILEKYSDKNLSLKMIFDDENISAIYAGRLFKASTGVSVGEYINSVRMEAAEKLLKTTNLTINQISNETGYLSSSYFCTLFKKKYNITPNEYRTKFRN